jgi:hypothetical protein
LRRLCCRRGRCASGRGAQYHRLLL